MRACKRDARRRVRSLAFDVLLEYCSTRSLVLSEMRALCVGCHRAPSASACPRLRVSSRAMANRQAALATHTEEVAAPFSVVWKLLEAKVYHPECVLACLLAAMPA